MYTTTRALVLRSVAYKESSRILTVLTDSDGKLTVSAQGAMRKNSRVAPAVQPLVFSEMTLSKNRDRYALTEAHVIEQFAELSLDLARFALAAYFAELLETVSDEDSPSAELLPLGLNALHILAVGDKPVELVKAAFELRLMCLAGFAPEVDELRADADTLAAIRYITSCDAKRLYAFELEKPKTLAKIAESYVTAQLERGFGSLEYYKKFGENQ
ncbi:MAG: DNA repair protein RecO [Oscillospiraceae bacterium]|jgi:DNA repair protein RecO (recombination protein O)|nr:DNA repair protein RecO [Oscillospiraceae bacterium]